MPLGHENYSTRTAVGIRILGSRSHPCDEFYFWDRIEQDRVCRLLTFQSLIRSCRSEKYNLRDAYRWMTFDTCCPEVLSGWDTVFVHRMRSPQIRTSMKAMLKSILPNEVIMDESGARFETDTDVYESYSFSASIFESLCRCIRFSLPCLLLGSEGSGKDSMVTYAWKRHKPRSDCELMRITMTGATDVTELLGCYRQAGKRVDSKDLVVKIRLHLREALLNIIQGL